MSAVIKDAVVTAFRKNGELFLDIKHHNTSHTFAPSPGSANATWVRQQLLDAQLDQAVEKFSGFEEHPDKGKKYDYLSASYDLESQTLTALLGRPSRLVGYREISVKGQRQDDRLDLTMQISEGASIARLTRVMHAEMRYFLSYVISATKEMPTTDIYLNGVKVHRTHSVQIENLGSGDIISIKGVPHLVTGRITPAEHKTWALTISPNADGSDSSTHTFTSSGTRLALIVSPRVDRQGAYAQVLAELPATKPAKKETEKVEPIGEQVQAGQVREGDFVDFTATQQDWIKALMGAGAPLVHGVVLKLTEPAFGWLWLTISSPDHSKPVPVRINCLALVHRTQD